MSNTLQTEFAGISLPNPFILASAPPATNPEIIARSFEMGWGGAIIKTVQYTPRWTKKNVTPRIRAVKSGGKIIGFTNFEIGSPKTLDAWAEGIAWLKQRFPEHAVFGSLMHTDVLNEHEWREVTRIFDQAGVDGIELNLSCSHGQAESGNGAALGADAEKIQMVTGWVRSETKKPVMPKLTALTFDVPGKGLAAKEAGADALTAINTLSALPGIDIDTFTPYSIVDGMSAFQGLSGKAIRPIALRCVAQLASATGLPISASGGAYTWRDAVEFILAGASTVQVCSAVMEYGYGIIDKLVSGLISYMESKDFSSIHDFSGKALPHITKQIALNRNARLYAFVDRGACVGCGRCVVSCADNGHDAIQMDDGKAVIVPERCDGCGLCTQICPKSCLQMVPVNFSISGGMQ